MLLNEAVHARIGRTAVVGSMVDGQAMISLRFPDSRLGDRPPVIIYQDGVTTGYSAMPTGCEESFVRSTRDTIEALRSAEAGRAVRLDEVRA